MKQFPTLTGKFFYATSNGIKAHIVNISYDAYLNIKPSRTLCNVSGELVHLGNRLVHDFQAGLQGINIVDICPDCLAAYNTQPNGAPVAPLSPAAPAPKRRKPARKKDITC